MTLVEPGRLADAAAPPRIPPPPAGLNFNQFLIDADQPLLLHTGQRSLFPLVSAAAAKVVDLNKLRWITYSHAEADECGAMNEWLAAAPNATAMQGGVGCNIWLIDAASRPPRTLADNEVIDLGGKRVRRLDTPHLPHQWDAGLIYEETTGTLFCSDLFTHLGNGAATTAGDVLGPSIKAEQAFGFTSLTSTTGRSIRRLAALAPKTLAIMHGSSYTGDGKAVLEGLAGYYEDRIRREVNGPAA